MDVSLKGLLKAWDPGRCAFSECGHEPEGDTWVAFRIIYLDGEPWKCTRCRYCGVYFPIINTATGVAKRLSEKAQKDLAEVNLDALHQKRAYWDSRWPLRHQTQALLANLPRVVRRTA